MPVVEGKGLWVGDCLGGLDPEVGAVVGEEDGGSAVGDTGVVDKPSVATLGAGVDHKDIVGRLRGGHLHHVSALELVPFGV